MKQPRKVALINVHDYRNYSAYYEIRVLDANEARGSKGNPTVADDGYVWGVRIYARQEFIQVPGVERACKILEEALDVAPTRDAADTAAQTWALEHMKKYAPPVSPVGQAGYASIGVLSGAWAFESLWNTLRRLFGPVFALAYTATTRNSRLNLIRDAVDAGAGAGLLRIYDGTRPATCGTATTLLAELTMSDPCAAAASGGVLTMSAITADSSANATGTATWFRLVDSTGTCAVDGNVGTSGSDLNLNTTSINTGVQVSVTSFTITAGNA